MKKLLFILLLLCPLLVLGQNHVYVSSTPPMRDAVSAHYAGWIRGKLWTWGGCNFPGVSCADGGEKVYYPIAYGASVQVPGGVAILGGTDGITSFDKCGFYSSSDRNYAEIAPLPKGLDNFAATYHDGMLWVAGGQCQGVVKDVGLVDFDCFYLGFADLCFVGYLCFVACPDYSDFGRFYCRHL